MSKLKWVIKPENSEQGIAVVKWINSNLSDYKYDEEGARDYFWYSENYSNMNDFAHQSLLPGYTVITFDEWLFVTQQTQGSVLIDTRGAILSEEPLIHCDNTNLSFKNNWDYVEYPFTSSKYWRSHEFIPGFDSYKKISLKIFKAMQGVKEPKVIGYNLKKEFSNSNFKNAVEALGASVSWGEDNPHVFAEPWIDLLSKAGVLDLWFEPVTKLDYKFKVGDFVVIQDTDNVRYYDKHKPDGAKAVGKIIKLDDLDFLGIESLNKGSVYIPQENRFEIDFYKGDFRLATVEEVKAYQNVEISGYPAEFHDGELSFGCQPIPKETLLGVMDLLSRPIKVELAINGTPVTIDTLYALISKL